MREGGTPIAGRDPELAALDAALRAETAPLVVISGEAGIGKTTVWEAGLEPGGHAGGSGRGNRPAGAGALVPSALPDAGNQRRAAREKLEQARGIFGRLGAPLWEERARRDLASVCGRPPKDSGLTETERRVAELVARGRTNREAAALLVVSERTVATHLTHIYAKLGLRSRTELARRLLGAGPKIRDSDDVTRSGSP